MNYGPDPRVVVLTHVVAKKFTKCSISSSGYRDGRRGDENVGIESVRRRSRVDAFPRMILL